MTKRDAISLMKKDIGITAQQAEKAFSQLVFGMKESMKNGKKVTFSGLGSFTVKEFQARKGRNPKTGAIITIPLKKKVKFTPSQSFIDELLNNSNQGYS